MKNSTMAMTASAGLLMPLSHTLVSQFMYQPSWQNYTHYQKFFLLARFVVSFSAPRALVYFAHYPASMGPHDGKHTTE